MAAKYLQVSRQVHTRDLGPHYVNLLGSKWIRQGEKLVVSTYLGTIEGKHYWAEPGKYASVSLAVAAFEGRAFRTRQERLPPCLKRVRIRTSPMKSYSDRYVRRSLCSLAKAARCSAHPETRDYLVGAVQTRHQYLYLRALKAQGVDIGEWG